MIIYTKEDVIFEDGKFTAEGMANLLLGSCYDFDMEDWSEEELKELDLHTFCCDSCGWWHSVDEKINVSGVGSICESCYDEEYSEDEEE